MTSGSNQSRHYHIHEYHLHTNFMTSPPRTAHLEPATNTTTAASSESVSQDGFEDIDLGQQNEDSIVAVSSIVNDNYNLARAHKSGAMPKRFLPKVIQSLDEGNHRKGSSSKRKRYSPTEETIVEVHEAPSQNGNIKCVGEKPLQGKGNAALEDTLFSFMEDINAELDIQGQQINRMFADIRQSCKVNQYFKDAYKFVMQYNI